MWYLKRCFLGVMLFSLPLLLVSESSEGQTNADSEAGKIISGGVVVGTDTFPVNYLTPVFVESRELSPEEKARLANLRYNVTKVYPYAVTAAYVIKQVDANMSIQSRRRDKKAYLRTTQKALNDKFKDELKDLSMTQGKILVKLINRETGRDCYDVIKELRGGLKARFYQTVAFFFNNNLKAQYDPYGEDKDIEMIVQEIEAKNYYRYQSQLMEQKAAMKSNH